MDKFDVAVIGAGPGGYVAAIRAAQLGGRVAVVEEGDLGGTCLNWGCIPTKTMLTGVKFLHGLERAREFGVAGEAALDWAALLKKKNRMVLRLRKGIEVLFRNQAIQLISGTGRAVSPGKIEVGRGDGPAEPVSAGQIILAASAVPSVSESRVPAPQGTSARLHPGYTVLQPYSGSGRRVAPAAQPAYINAPRKARSLSER